MVSTFLFVLIIGIPIAVLTSIDEGPMAPGFQFLVTVLSAIIAAIVVWSDDIPCIGDA